MILKLKKLTELDDYIDKIDNQSLKEKEAYIFGTNYIDGSNDEYKIVPISVLNADYDIRYAFFAGYYYAYKRRYCLNEEIEKCIKFSNKSKIATSVLFYIIKSLGLYVNLDTYLDKFIITCSDMEIDDCINNGKDMDKEVKKCDLIHESYTDYVYDIETKTGNFNSGFALIVKNTDSVFLKFECIYPEDHEKAGQKMTGMDAIYESIRLCTKCSKEITDKLPKPHNLEFEKCIYPFILLSKKRYVGNYYTDFNESFYTNSMGIVLKRRDNAPIVKHIYGGVVNIILKGHLAPEFKKIQEDNPNIDIKKYMIEKANKFVIDETKKLLNGEFTMDKFIITKSLRAEYKNEDSIAHKVLANRMGDRDPGNKPQSNDRIPYAYIEVNAKKGEKILQGDKIENPDFIIENKLKLDYKTYLTNQVQKPVAQIFGLVVEYLKGYIPGKKNFEKFKERKKRDEKKAEYAGELLFQDALRVYDNKRSGKREITEFFKPKMKIEEKIEEVDNNKNSDSSSYDSDEEEEENIIDI